jgi:chromosome segregation ATPase
MFNKENVMASGTLTKRGVRSIDTKLAAHMKQVATARDKLDETIGELTSLREDCDEAYDCLQRARDALSEMV